LPSLRRDVILVILSFTVLALAVAVFALYRMVAASNIQLGNGPSVTRWPFSGLMVGHEASALLGAPSNYSGFILLCADDTDALGAVYSTSVIANEWDENLVVAQVASSQPSGWLTRSDHPLVSELWATVTEVTQESLTLMKPDQLPICVYLREGRVVDASPTIASPSLIASRFTHVVSPTPRSLV
jgi:hypothetical protein